MAEELVSGVKTVEAPDGSSFGILRGAPEKAAAIRGQALVDMRKIAEEREPDLLRYLQTRPSLSAEYAMGAALLHAKDKGVKADLVRVRVDSNLAEGHRSSAVDTLAYANAAELELPEYNEDFVTGLYDQALANNDAGDAWFIASKMVREGEKIVKAGSEEVQATSTEAWQQRENRAFSRYAEDVLSREAQTEEGGHNWELEMIFNECRFREDGYLSDEPSELSTRIAEAMIQKHLRTPGREWIAIIDATEAGMSEEYIKELKKKVAPTALAQKRVRKWLSGVRENLSRVMD